MTTITNPLAEHVLVHNGDEDIKAMCVANGFTFPPEPPPGKDTAFASLHDKASRHYWLVIRIYHTSDAGYLAFGLPDTSPLDRVKEFFRFLIETTPAQGDLEFTELSAPSTN